jgi:hypothetical protein
MNLIITLAVVILIVTWRLYRIKIKGVIGEKITAVILKFLNKSEYKVVNNLVLMLGDQTTQIDHVVISEFGIFVIETKNYKGWYWEVKTQCTGRR